MNPEEGHENGGRSRSGFFERKPWMGAAAFAILAVITGVVLVNVIGVRPHYRFDDWTLYTKVPPAGTGMDGGPARCLIPEEYRRDPIRVVVLATVQDDLQRPCGHLEVVLATNGRTRLISYGVTEPRGGTLHLALPARFDQDLFSGQVEALVLMPGLPPVATVVPPPRKGEAAVTLRVPASRTVDFKLRRADGVAHTGEAQVIVCTADDEPLEISRGFRVVGGQTKIGGLPDDVALRFLLKAPGLNDQEQVLRFPARAGDVPAQELFMGQEQAFFECHVVDADGAALGMTSLSVRDGSRERVIVTDEGGRLSVPLHASLGGALVLSHPASGDRADWSRVVISNLLLMPGETWDAGTVRFGKAGERSEIEGTASRMPGKPPAPATEDTVVAAERAETSAPPRAGDAHRTSGGVVTVQHRDGLPVGDAIVQWAPLAAGRSAGKNPAPMRRREHRSARNGQVEIPARMMSDANTVVAHSALGHAFKEAPEFPLFLGLEPYGSAHLSVSGLPALKTRPAIFVDVEPEDLDAPEVVKRVFDRPPVPLSSLDRCRLDRLLPGTWTVWLRIHARARGTVERRLRLGSITVPGSGEPVHQQFKLDPKSF